MAAPDELSAERAARLLRRHARRELPPGRPEAATPRRARRARRGRHRRRPARILATVGALAAAATALVALPLGDGRSGGLPAAVQVPDAQAALLRLADRIDGVHAPAGDATLVVRRHVFADGSAPVAGHDLYTDDGRYFYGPTAEGLRAAIAAGTRTDYRWRKVLDAAIAAGGIDPAAGRELMLDASLAPGFREMTMPPARAGGERAPDPVPHDRRTLDSQLWVEALDALTAGAGDPRVRAGVLRVLATVATVATDETTHAGRAVLRLRATDAVGRYEERLLLDARTGVIVQLQGGAPGERPDVTITYVVRRIDRATLGG